MSLNDLKKTRKQLFATHPVPGQFRTFVYVYVYVYAFLFSFPEFLPNKFQKQFFWSSNPLNDKTLISSILFRSCNLLSQD